MTEPDDLLTIGELAGRAGVATSTLRFYEDRGLLSSTRSAGNQRRYRRADLRRVSVIRAAQQVGVPLAAIGEALAALPERRTPTTNDWASLSTAWRAQLDRRIDELAQLRDQLDECIGCGCVSLKSCGIFNPADQIAERGSGARYLAGDEKVPID